MGTSFTHTRYRSIPADGIDIKCDEYKAMEEAYQRDLCDRRRIQPFNPNLITIEVMGDGGTVL